MNSERPSSENKSWTENLQKVLDSYDYGQSYRENVFDCSNTSQICWSILQGKGYDARLMMSYKGHPLDPHMWVVVRYPYEAERYVAIEATNTDKSKKLIHLGMITMKDDYYKGIMYNTSAQFSWLHPEEGNRQQLIIENIIQEYNFKTFKIRCLRLFLFLLCPLQS